MFSSLTIGRLAIAFYRHFIRLFARSHTDGHHTRGPAITPLQKIRGRRGASRSTRDVRRILPSLALTAWWRAIKVRVYYPFSKTPLY